MDKSGYIFHIKLFFSISYIKPTLDGQDPSKNLHETRPNNDPQGGSLEWREITNSPPVEKLRSVWCFLDLKNLF
jgi:hypothetical protein